MILLNKMIDITQGRTLVHKLCQKIPWVEDEVDLKQVAAESEGFTDKTIKTRHERSEGRGDRSNRLMRETES